MSFEDCLRKGLIKKDFSAVERVKSSLEIAERFLRSARRNFEIEDYEMVEIAAYNSPFTLWEHYFLQKDTRKGVIIA